MCLRVKGGLEGGFPLDTSVNAGEKSVSAFLCKVRKKRQPFTSVYADAHSLFPVLVRWDSEDKVVCLSITLRILLHVFFLLKVKYIYMFL